jgi:hypothetical protein
VKIAKKNIMWKKGARSALKMDASVLQQQQKAKASLTHSSRGADDSTG